MRSDSEPRLQFALFDTVLGRCGIAWSDRGIARVELPGAGEQRIVRLLRACGAVVMAQPPTWVADVIRRIVSHFDGELDDFATVPLDMSGVSEFAKKVYLAARSVGPGHTASYGELASMVGAPGGARATGRALGGNRFGLIVPCHRIVASDGRLGGFSAVGGLPIKARMLALERIARPTLCELRPLHSRVRQRPYRAPHHSLSPRLAERL